MVVTRPEDIYPALVEGYNSGDLEAVVSLYDPKAAFVIKPGRVTQSPAELHSALGPSRFAAAGGTARRLSARRGSQTCCGASRTAVGSWSSIIPMVMTKIHLAVTHRPHGAQAIKYLRQTGKGEEAWGQVLYQA